MKSKNKRKQESFRQTAAGILQTVNTKGKITRSTLDQLLEALTLTQYDFHIEVAVRTGAVLKTIDNEEDALETCKRINSRYK